MSGGWQPHLRGVARNQSLPIAPPGKPSRISMRAAIALRRPLRLMRPRTWRRHLISLGVILGTALAGSASEIGRPAFRDFPPGRSNIGWLMQSVAQDGAGYVYTAGSWNFFCFDGTTWSRIDLPPEDTGARRIVDTAGGTLFAGGAGTIGFFRRAGPVAEYVSLADRLPPALRENLDLHDALAVGETVYFADEEKILRWRDARFTVIPCPAPPRTRGARLYRVGDTVYAAVPGRGLCRIVDDHLEEVSTDPVLRENALVLLEAGRDGALVTLTAARGFFRISADRVAPLPTEANRWLAGKTIWRALRLRDGSLAVIFSAVSGDGGMRFDAAGRYAGAIDQTLGLYLREFRDLFQDREGGLWLGSEVGLFRLEWPSPLSIFDAVNGLGAGAVADVARHDGVLYAATGEGLFRLHPADADGRRARFERLATFPAHALLAHPAGLLIAGYAELFALTPKGPVAIATFPAGGGTLHRSHDDPARVWVATTGGPLSVRHTPAGWSAETGATAAAREAAQPTFLADTAPARNGEARWIAAPTEIFRPTPAGGKPQRLPHLVLASSGKVAKLWEEHRDGVSVLWICGERGLVRVDLSGEFPAPVPFAAQLTATGVRAGDHLTPEHGSIFFHFVALRHQIPDSVTYQTRLAGLENSWSDWTTERTRSFVRLPAGAYRFEVRARDADGVFSTPGTLAFTVLAPWWLTSWAWLGYFATAAAVVTGIVRLRTRALRGRADHLEAVVTQRTRELAEKNLELIRLNQLELDEKTAARLAEEKARLEVLRYQLNPHFLFNTLASISSALPSAQSPARTMVERLANFCRLTLHRADDHEWTTLGEEMRLLRVYLEIEQSRWGDLLDVAIACDPAIEAERLPHFLLLPLVENALKYGRATSPDRVGLRLTARREAGSGTASRSGASGLPATDGTESGSATDDVLVLEVSNTGTWIEPSAKKTVSSLGIGLHNLRERLARYYPRTHELTLAHADGWVTVTLRLSSRYQETGDTRWVRSDL